MEIIDLKAFKDKYDLTNEALAKILNVSIHTVNDWIYRNKGISKKYSEILRMYDKNGLPVLDSNTISVVSNDNDNCKKQIDILNNQINNLIDTIKEKDKQITILLNKL